MVNDKVVQEAGSGKILSIVIPTYNMEKYLPVCHAKHLPGLILAFGDAFNASAVYLGKIRCIVDDKCGQNSSHAALYWHTEGKAGHIKYNNDLQHQRRSPYYPDESARQPAQGPKAAHGAKAHDEPKRKGGCQSDEENQASGAEAFQQLHGNDSERHSFQILLVISYAQAK